MDEKIWQGMKKSSIGDNQYLDYLWEYVYSSDYIIDGVVVPCEPDSEMVCPWWDSGDLHILAATYI
jgi:hypothetical protein